MKLVDTAYLGCVEEIRTGSNPVILIIGYRLIGRSGAFQALSMGSSPIIRILHVRVWVTSFGSSPKKRGSSPRHAIILFVA